MNHNTKQSRLSKKLALVSIPTPVLISLLFYIGTLTATQTVYGKTFLTLRWVALGTFTLVSFIFWLVGRIGQKDGGEPQKGPVMVFIYLGATLLSVATAENHEFSGLKWMTQGMLILSCMVFLRGTFNPEKTEDLLLPLKIIGLVLFLVSFIFPAPLNLYDNPYFRGAMGDSNSFGHVSAICALVYLQGAVTAKSRSWRILQAMMAGFAMVMVVQSGARSSMAAFLAGFILISYYFGLTRSLLMKAAVFLIIAFILASPGIHERIGGFVTKEDRALEKQSKAQALGMFLKSGMSPGLVFATRERLWSEAWEGFSERPVLGWGFGANAHIPKEWTIGPTGYTMTRDVTNDLLFTLEGSGFVGLFGYLLLMLSILRALPARREILIIRKDFKKGSPSRPMEGGNHSVLFKTSRSLPGGLDASRRAEGDQSAEDLTVARAYVHSQMYILSVSLFVLFLFDGSAFSAGSIISAIFWISAGAASLTRMKDEAREGIDHWMMIGWRGASNQGVK